MGGSNPGDTNVLASAPFVLQVVPFLPSTFLALDPARQSGLPGETLTFGGRITNAGSSAVFLNGASLNAPAELTGDTGPFLNSPLSLNPGTYEFGVPLFTVVIAPNAPFGPLPDGVLTLSGGIDGGAQDVLGSTNFSVLVTPEPSTWILFTGAGLLAAAIRRINRTVSVL